MIRSKEGKKTAVKWSPGGGKENVRGKEGDEKRKKKKPRLANSPPGQITESKPQQQPIKSQQYLPLKCSFLRQDRSFHFISMQMGWLSSAHTHTHSRTQYGKKIMLTHACTNTHTRSSKHAPKCYSEMAASGEVESQHERKWFRWWMSRRRKKNPSAIKQYSVDLQFGKRCM